jgi:hypothetical protein
MLKACKVIALTVSSPFLMLVPCIESSSVEEKAKTSKIKQVERENNKKPFKEETNQIEKTS